MKKDEFIAWIQQLKPSDIPEGCRFADGRQIKDREKWLKSIQREVANPHNPRHKYGATMADIKELYSILNPSQSTGDSE